MQYGLFTMPSHPPERSLYDGHRWDLQTLRWADELGFAEAWIGEHHTAPWEPHPSPDLLIAQALMETKRIRLAPGGFLLPYHHPAELANRVAMLDHMAQGRLNFGVAASGLPSDWAMFHVDGNSGQHREMTREALDIILKLWTADEPFDYLGKYWQVSLIEPQLRTLRAAHQAVPEALSADRRRRGQRWFGDVEAGGRAWLPADEPQPQPGVCRQPLGIGRGRRPAQWQDPAPLRLAAGARNLRRRHRRGCLAAFGRRPDGPDDARVLPAAANRCRRHPVPQARRERRRQRRNPGILRHSQLVDRLARRQWSRRSSACTRKSAVSARCCCSASTTARTPRRGAIRCGCSPKR